MGYIGTMSDGLFQITWSKGLPMFTSIPRTAAWAALLGAGLFLGACVTSNEDSPVIDPAFADQKVDARVAGQTLTGTFKLGMDWNTTVTAPAGFQGLGTVSTGIGALKKSTALPKLSAEVDLDGTLHANLEDTAKGYATVYSQSQFLFTHIEDTAIVKWDDKAKDTIHDNENIISFKRVSRSPGDKVETAEFTDGDGDKIITAAPGKESKIHLVLTLVAQGAKEKTSLLVGAGADADFNKEEDNTILEATWVKTDKDGMVTGTGAFLDADGDGVIADNSKTCLVLARYSEFMPKDRPLILQVDFDAKVRVLPNKSGDEPVTFSYTETTLGHRTNKATIKNRAGGDEIVRGDTLTVRLETTVANASDTLKHATVDFVMNPGQDLKSDADDVCYAIHIATQKKLGLEREAEFHFIPDLPIPHGQDPVAGSFYGSAKYANGQSASLKGSFSASGFSAEYTGPEGKNLKVEYSKNGTVTTP
jgi:hypothetical protein